jgi:hypothetical protein
MSSVQLHALLEAFQLQERLVLIQNRCLSTAVGRSCNSLILAVVLSESAAAAAACFRLPVLGLCTNGGTLLHLLIMRFVVMYAPDWCTWAAEIAALPCPALARLNRG